MKMKKIRYDHFSFFTVVKVCSNYIISMLWDEILCTFVGGIHW